MRSLKRICIYKANSILRENMFDTMQYFDNIHTYKLL